MELGSVRDRGEWLTADRDVLAPILTSNSHRLGEQGRWHAAQTRCRRCERCRRDDFRRGGDGLGRRGTCIGGPGWSHSVRGPANHIRGFNLESIGGGGGASEHRRSDGCRDPRGGGGVMASPEGSWRSRRCSVTSCGFRHVQAGGFHGGSSSRISTSKARATAECVSVSRGTTRGRSGASSEGAHERRSGW